MPRFGGIVAHLIVGSKHEPYLSAALESIADVCDHAVVNDNSGADQTHNCEPILHSRLARSGRLTVVRSSFVDFATARNACIEATPARLQSGWALFVDADEVHGDELPAMASLLPSLPDQIEAVDGYSRHFVGSFSWWMAIERRQCFFRLRRRPRWHGRIHERLAPLGDRIVLPAVWFHYGHVVTPQAEAEKSRLYASLGQKGIAPAAAQVIGATPASVWSRLMKDANRYGGEHPSPAAGTIEHLSTERKHIFAEVDALAQRQNFHDRVRNSIRQVNYSRLLAWRGAQARLRWGWPDCHTPAEPAPETLRISNAEA
jgi:hypothetical protein